MNKLTQLMLALATLSATTASAQLSKRNRNAAVPDMPVHEASIYLQGGVGSLQYTSLLGNSSMNIGYGGGLSYTYFFKPQVGLTTGLEAMFLNGALNLSSPFTETLSSPDYRVSLKNLTTLEEQSTQYSIRNNISKLEETQAALFVQLPLMVQYQMVVKPGAPHYLYAAGGLKVGMAVMSSYTQTLEGTSLMDIDLDHFGLTVGDEYYGLGALNSTQTGSKLDLGINLSGTLELGARWQLPKDMALYTGLFFDYGFLNLASSSGDKALVPHDPTRIYSASASPRTAADYNSVLATDHQEGVHALSFGLKLRYAMAVGPIKKRGGGGQKSEARDKYYRKRAYVRLVARDITTDRPLEATLEVFDRENNRFADSVLFEVGSADYRIPIPSGVAYNATFSVKLPADVEVPKPTTTTPPPSTQKVVEGTGVIRVAINDARTGYPLPFRVTIIDNITQTIVDSANVNPETGSFETYIPMDKTYRLLLGVRVPTSSRKAVSTALTIPFKQLKVGQKVMLRNILFDSGKSDIKSTSHAELQKIVEFMKQYTDIRLEVSGHTDNVGSPENNKRISTARAKAVVDYLVSNGIARERLRPIGFGATRPVAANSTTKGRSLNRRLELKIIK
jgi:outer membrane protein OmpA-like peptidoglycan-associated protein